MHRIFFAAGLAFFLGACAPRALRSSPEGTGETPATVVHLTNVPFYPNTSDQCGPAALASLLNYWGRDVSLEETKTEVYLPSLHGTLPMDILPALERKGLKGRVFSGTFEDIKNEIRQKRPVIAYLDFGTRHFPIRHFLVVTGFDDERRGLIVHSGDSKDKFASYARFNRGWKDTDHWMLTASSADDAGESPFMQRRVPQFESFMSAEDYFQLGTTYLSQDLPQEAAAQFQSALKINKSYEPALMALGNLAYEEDNLKMAKHYYRQVLRVNKGHGGANNNLAMVYLKEGKNLKVAEQLASKALATDYRPYAEETLEEINKRKVSP